MSEVAEKVHPISVGKVAILPHTVTEEDVRKFAEVTGDYNPVHMDEEYAKDTIFNGRIVHGAFGVGLISRVIAESLPGQGSVFLSQYVKYLKPVRIGDELRVIVEIIATEQKRIQTSEMMLLSCRYRLRTSVRNQKDDLVIDGEAEVLR